MPSGAKKRKALKKKKQQEAIGTSGNNEGSNGNNLRGQDEHGSQDERESDSNLSSPGSQGNEDPSAALSSSLEKGSAKEISGDADVTHGLGPNSGNAISVERGMDYKEVNAEKSPNSYSENAPCQDACGESSLEIAPLVVDSIKPVVSVSKEVICEKSEHAETTTHSNLVTQKSDVNEVYQSQTSQKVESARKPQEPEEKLLLVPGPQAVRTSWLSCCGLFDAMTGSDR